MGLVMLSLADGAGRPVGLLEGNPPAVLVLFCAAFIFLSMAGYLLARAPAHETYTRR